MCVCARAPARARVCVLYYGTPLLFTAVAAQTVTVTMMIMMVMMMMT